MSPWITRSFPNPKARARLFCFPYAGGGATVFFPWAQAWRGLPVEVCSVRLPARESRFREPPVTRLEPVIESLSSAIHEYPDLPFGFFGHSMGALIAFELARALRRNGEVSPTRFFASGASPPDQVEKEEYPHRLPDGEFLEVISRRYRGLPAEVLTEPDLLNLVLPALRGDFTLMAGYRYLPEPPLDCPLVVLGGTDDTWVRPAKLSQWRQHTSNSFTLRLFAGDHFFVNQARAEVMSLVARELQLD